MTSSNIVKELLTDHYGEAHIPAELMSKALQRSLSPSLSGKSKLSRGLCVIRTRGNRLELLSEALASVRRQSITITCCIVVHAERHIFLQIERWLSELDITVILLHADRLDKMRGYPLNVALDYLRCNGDNFDFICFLDDDDILYPLFAERLVAALELSGAEIAFGLANQRVPWEPPQLVHRALPAPALVAGNFIPINSYILRVDALLNSGARVREDMDYLEDWDFLLSLLAFGVTFHYLPEVVCEYRIIGDGNQATRRNPQHYDECNDRVKIRGLNAARKLKRGHFFESLNNFNFREPKVRESELSHIKMALSVFDCVSEQDFG